MIKSAVCHGSTILSTDFLGQLNHAHKSWPTLSIVCHQSASMATRSRATWNAAVSELSCSFSLVPDANRYLQQTAHTDTRCPPEQTATIASLSSGYYLDDCLRCITKKKKKISHRQLGPLRGSSSPFQHFEPARVKPN